MGSYRQRFLYNLSTAIAFLRSETWVHSNDLMSSTFSLGFKDVEERAPGGVHDGFREMVILHHIAYLKVFYSYAVIGRGVLVGHFEMVISTLAANLQVRLGNIASRLASTFAARLSAAKCTLLTPERFLRAAIEAGVRNRIAFAIGKEDFQPHINANIRMGATAWKMFGMWLSFADDESIPMTVSAMDEVNHLGRAFYRAMQLDLEQLTELGRDMQMFAISIQPHITRWGILSQLDAMPPVRFLEAGKPDIRQAQLFSSKESFERLGETISQHLDGGGGNMFPSTSLESGGQVILRWKRPLLCILYLNGLKHRVIDMPRLPQASHEQFGLFLIRIEAILKRSHVLTVRISDMVVKREVRLAAAFHPP